MTTDKPIDVAIIGGGPAGYAAAIYAARANLTTTVLEQGMSGGQIATSNEIENYPGIPLLSGAELGERFQQHAEGLGAQVEWSMVTGVDYNADAGQFTIHHDMGDTAAKSVIACMGATPRPAGLLARTRIAVVAFRIARRVTACSSVASRSLLSEAAIRHVRRRCSCPTLPAA